MSENMVQSNNEEKKEEAPVLSFQIPACCREGWEDCPHIPKQERSAKENIGL